LRKKTEDENARRFFQSEELRESVFRRKAAAASRANATSRVRLETARMDG